MPSPCKNAGIDRHDCFCCIDQRCTRRKTIGFCEYHDSYIEVVYLCRHYHGELKPQEEEISELRFFHLKDLPEISDPIVPVIRAFVNRYSNNNQAD